MTLTLASSAVVRSTSRVRVRYAETDQMRVAYHANYFAWFEVARTDLLRHAGWSYRDMEQDGCGLPVLEAQCAYQQSARYDDELDIEAAGQLLSAVRIQFDYVVRRAADGASLATGRTTHAAVDTGGRPCRLPARVVAIFNGERTA